MQSTNGKLSDEAKLLELYKELGSDVRHFDRHIYIVNFQMVPALVIGLLALYGRINKFLAIEFEHPDAVYPIVWMGCVLISLMWIIAVSRFAQVFHIHMKTRQQCECLLGLNGHRKIGQMDEKSRFSKWIRHYILRLVGFGLYLFLLLIRCPFDNVIEFIEGIVGNCCLYLLCLILSAAITYGIWRLYFYKKLKANYGSPLLMQSDNASIE